MSVLGGLKEWLGVLGHENPVYGCKKCDKFLDPGTRECPECGGEVMEIDDHYLYFGPGH